MACLYYLGIQHTSIVVKQMSRSLSRGSHVLDQIWNRSRSRSSAVSNACNCEDLWSSTIGAMPVHSILSKAFPPSTQYLKFRKALTSGSITEFALGGSNDLATMEPMPCLGRACTVLTVPEEIVGRVAFQTLNCSSDKLSFHFSNANSSGFHSAFTTFMY